MKNNGRNWLQRNGEAIKAAVMLGFFLALMLCFASIAKGENLDKELPALDGLTTYGCYVNGPIRLLDPNDAAGRERDVWKATFWAAHKSVFDKKPRKDWKLLYSFRKKRIKALTDCDKFLDRVRAAVARHAVRSAKK